MSERSWKVMPGNRLGRWSVGLIAAMPILFILGTSFASSLYETVPAGDNLLEDIAVRPFLSLTMLAGVALGVSGFITGLLAIVKQKEKAILLYLSTLIGGLLTLYILSLVVFPQ